MATLIKIHTDGREEFKEQGARVEAIEWNENGTFKSVLSNIPVEGCSMLVGSVTARTYAAQDYWLTTAVSKIVESNIDEEGRPISFIFETKTGSTYKLTY